MYEYRNLDYDTSATDPITINTWYVPLLPTANVKAYYLIVEQTNNGATAEDIVVELTIDGTVVFASLGCASGTVYYMRLDEVGGLRFSGTVRQVLSLDDDQSAPLEDVSLGIRVRQTSAVDAVSAIIEVNMVYATLEAA